jgi:hypothetical protein
MISFLHWLCARLRNRQFDDELREELRVHEEMKRESLEGVARRRKRPAPPHDGRLAS